MLELNTPAPPFRLPDCLSGRDISLEDFADKKALLVIFLCAHCPFVIHVEKQLASLPKNYADRGLGAVAITSNNVKTHPQDSPENTARWARSAGFRFPVLYDESQQVAHAFKAACTPDFYLFDGDRRLVYRGQLDESRPGNGKPVNGADLRAAVEAVLEGRRVPEEQHPSMGCNIKWKPGNEPEWGKL